MIGKDSAETHGASMEDGLVTQGGKGLVSMDNIDSFPKADVTKGGEKGKDGRESGLLIDHQERDVVDLEPIGHPSDPCSVPICMSDDDNLMSPLNQPLGQVVQVRFNSTHIREEKVRDHTTSEGGRKVKRVVGGEAGRRTYQMFKAIVSKEDMTRRGRGRGRERERERGRRKERARQSSIRPEAKYTASPRTCVTDDLDDF